MLTKVESKITKWKEESRRIDGQLEEYRQQMENNSSSIDDDLSGGRKRLAAKVKERETYSNKLAESANYLADHFKDKTECEDLFIELEDLDRNSVLIEPQLNSI